MVKTGLPFQSHLMLHFLDHFFAIQFVYPFARHCVYIKLISNQIKTKFYIYREPFSGSELNGERKAGHQRNNTQDAPNKLT